MGINLLPPKYRPKPLIDPRRLLKQLTVVLIIFGFFSLGGVYYLYRYTHLEGKLENLEGNINNLRPVLEKVQQSDKASAKIKEFEAVAAEIQKSKESWSQMLADIAGCLEEDIWFVQINKENNSVYIRGEARDFSTIGDLAIKLRRLSWFENVDVENAKSSAAESISFLIRLDIFASENKGGEPNA